MEDRPVTIVDYNPHWPALYESERQAILESIAATSPLSKTMEEKINRFRNWAQGRARNASGIRAEEAATVKRKIEF